MFGYVRPLKGELKVKEYEHFKAEYCGLCHAIKRGYGPAATMLLTYDITFLAVLFSAMDGSCGYEHRRCASSPFRKKCVACEGPGLKACAAASVILGWWKIDDSIRDRRFFASLPYRLVRSAIGRAHRKAAAEYPEYEGLVKAQLERLWALEKENSDELDAAADTFALMLAGAAELTDSNYSNELRQLLYHVGRWIYIIDACDDAAADSKDGSYNAVLRRFGLDKAPIPQDIRDYIAVTAGHSLSIAREASKGIAFKSSREIIENILTQGLPFIMDRVLDGTWNTKNRKSYDKSFSN